MQVRELNNELLTEKSLQMMVDKVFESGSIPYESKESVRATVISILSKHISFDSELDRMIDNVNTIVTNTKNLWNGFEVIVSSLSLAVEKIKEIEDLTIDGFLKSETLAKFIADREIELATNKELAQTTQKAFLLGMIKQVRELNAIDEKIKIAEKEQLDAYSDYNRNPFLNDVLETRESEYQNAKQLIQKLFLSPNRSYHDNEEYNNLLLTLCSVFWLKLDEDYQYYKKHVDLAIHLLNSIKNANGVIGGDYPVKVNGCLVSLFECRKKIELALNSPVVISVKKQLGMQTTTAKNNFQSSTSVINAAIQPCSELKENTPVIPMQSTLLSSPKATVASKKDDIYITEKTHHSHLGKKALAGTSLTSSVSIKSSHEKTKHHKVDNAMHAESPSVKSSSHSNSVSSISILSPIHSKKVSTKHKAHDDITHVSSSRRKVAT